MAPALQPPATGAYLYLVSDGVPSVVEGELALLRAQLHTLPKFSVKTLWRFAL
jgi:hypothetical protein